MHHAMTNEKRMMPAWPLNRLTAKGELPERWASAIVICRTVSPSIRNMNSLFRLYVKAPLEQVISRSTIHSPGASL
eukprot:7186228-Prymnesium_polylepis.1